MVVLEAVVQPEEREPHDPVLRRPLECEGRRLRRYACDRLDVDPHGRLRLPAKLVNAPVTSLEFASPGTSTRSRRGIDRGAREGSPYLSPAGTPLKGGADAAVP